MKFSAETDSLVISLGYLPNFGGSYRVLHELIKRYKINKICLLTSKGINTEEFDNKLTYRIIRSNFLSILNEDAIFYKKIKVKNIYKYLHYRLLKKIFSYILFPSISFLYIIYLCKNKQLKTIVFAQSVFPFAWYIIILKHITQKKIITFVYGEDIVCYRKSGKTFRYLRKIYIKGLYNADLIIANSNITSEEILSEGIESKKVQVIYPAVDYDMFKPQNKENAKKKFDLTNKFVLLSVGRLIRRKGFDSVLNTLPILRDKIPEITYIICGDGYDKEYLERIVNNKELKSCVLFLSGLPYEELPYLYSASDIFILPNRLDEKDNEQEGFGIVFLEAIACGLPVIGGNSGGVKDIISNDENGFLINPNDIKEISNKVIELYSLPYKFRDSYFRNNIIERFNWEYSSKAFEKLL